MEDQLKFNIIRFVFKYSETALKWIADQDNNGGLITRPNLHELLAILLALQDYLREELGCILDGLGHCDFRHI